jgi:hypothetical protein
VGENAKKVRVGGTMVGLYALEEIFEEVRRRNLSGDALGDELIRLVRVYNYVPDDQVKDYEGAVLRAYLESGESTSS